ncbi:glycosyltransferase [Alkalicoccobacillus gibsonii]|uniref:glycosyltransferase n=1 Tax=Alkalicoccobacillus gibsonii TaxID=79881 RepID=UPI001931DE77|nr:glycosyltransferase [Alkalicoccobacillus gibsonii]MBM0065898.1 glycosyltransferase [Alkalicoccobacillus gibsonii]
MKIIHYTLGNPPFRSGGLTKYAYDLISKQCDDGNDISILFPGAINRSKMFIKKNKSYKKIKVYEILNPLPVPVMRGIKAPKDFMKSGNISVYNDFFSLMKPDILHIHTLMGVHEELLIAAKRNNVKVIFTSHDYFGICPKVNLFNYEDKVCEDFNDGLSCVKCNKNAPSTKKIQRTQSKTYRLIKSLKILDRYKSKLKLLYSKKFVINNINSKHNIDYTKYAVEYVHLREYYKKLLSNVDVFHFNSTTARDVYSKYINPSKSKIIPVTNSDISKKPWNNYLNLMINSKVKFGFIGPKGDFKGLPILLKNLQNVLERGYNNWELNIFGCSGESTENVKYHGNFDPKDIDTIFENIDLLVVPSIWKETFGFTGLEALVRGIPVVISENVGMKDILEYNKKLIFRINDLEELIISILKDPTKINDWAAGIQLSEEIYFDNHSLEIKKLYEEVLNNNETN